MLELRTRGVLIGAPRGGNIHVQAYRPRRLDRGRLYCRCVAGLGRAAAAPLKELGAHPTSGSPVRVLSGKYGPYINADGINANVPRGSDPMEMTLDQAVVLLAERAGKPSGKRPSARGVKSSGAKAKPAKKAPAKAKAAGAKSTETKTAAKRKPAAKA